MQQKKPLSVTTERLKPCLDETSPEPSITWSQAEIPNFNNPHFPQKVTSHFLTKISPNRSDDPLLLQILPRQEESIVTPHEKIDPVGDVDAIAAPGVIHKYPGRALVYVTNECTIHCRFCFRKNSQRNLSTATDHIEDVINYFETTPSISEAILSGGDPFCAPLPKVSTLLEQLDRLNHLKRIRIHTRVPVTLPELISPGWERLLSKLSKRLTIVLHSNHPNEIDCATEKCLEKFQKAGATLLSQAVLLRSINDHPDVLVRLFEALFKAGVLPYYLHLLDPAAGTSHFHVSDDRAKEIWRNLQSTLPGYLVPRLVREIPGELSKRIVCK